MGQPKIDGVGHGIPRTIYGSDGSNWYAILVDSDGHVKIDVVTSALPSGAAIETKQDTMITALQLIDDLRNALGSVNTDDLQVDVKTYPGVNALLNIPFGYNDRYAESVSVAGTGGEVFANGSAVPAGEVWVVTQATIFHSDTTARSCNIQALISAVGFDIALSLSLAQWVALDKQGWWVLKEGDKMRGRFVSLDVGDTGYAQFMGFKTKVA